mmetsp:Transcript_21800/g.52094  ORF Transcript_21800/g.52094 Transcript_21800/m.52094 type:complete len:375 (-) Transcript_21800:558-1682(-)
MSERYAFVTEWTDPNTEVTWRYQLFFYFKTGEIEMVDIKNRRPFLKKTKYKELNPDSFYVGNVVTIFSRQLKIIEYGDEYTKKSLSSKTEKTLALVKPDAYQYIGKIIQAIFKNGFQISKMRMCQLSREDACRFYSVHQGKPFFDKLTEFMSSGRVLAMELRSADAVGRWRALLGPTDSEAARREAPGSLRALYGTDNTCNACHGSDSHETAEQEISFFFGQRLAPCHYGQQSTLGMIKPSALEKGAAGDILDAVLERFHITAMELFHVDRAAAAEFYEVYKGVVHPGEFSSMVDELSRGPLIAFEIIDPDGADPCEPFRELCGPADPEIARVLRAGTLRARFGDLKVTNAVHSTDLAEDGPLEVNYFFEILQG